MASLKEIKVRIASVKKTQQITKAMKMVAASKMKKATDAISNTRPYAEKLHSLIANLTTDAQSFGHQFTEKRDVENVLLVVVAADKGLCGGFNSNIRKQSIQKIEKYREKGHNVSVLSIGRKAVEMARKFENVEILSEYPNIFGKLSFETALAISDELKTFFVEGKADKVDLVYNRFVSAISQVPTFEQYLPLEFQSEEDEIKNVDYIYEPDKIELINTLIPQHLNTQVLKMLLESNAAEQAARMMAMDSATENAGEIIKTLNLTYNKLRQAKITSEIAEIVGGAAALEG
jgi:F-type H+-transporting ATPase subunit gamma